MKDKKHLNALYSFPGFRARARLNGIFQDPMARVIELKRRQKKQPARYAEKAIGVSTTG
jgi:hypothetical protein